MSTCMIDWQCPGCRTKTGCSTTTEAIVAGQVKCPRCGTPYGGKRQPAQTPPSTPPASSPAQPSRSSIDAARSVVMPFGKHRGKTLGDIADTDILYLDWINGTDIRSGQLRAAVITLCTEYAQEIEDTAEQHPRRR